MKRFNFGWDQTSECDCSMDEHPEGQYILYEDIKTLLDFINSDENAQKIATNCHDEAHDKRWCSTCEDRGAGIEEYREELNKLTRNNA